jgi:hypothetical protein
VNQHVRKVMRAYVLYWLRSYFELPGYTGEVTGSNVPISFVLDEAPTVAGTAGVDYNRIEIGGAALRDAASDNPDLSWGNVPVDVDNAIVDDISDGGPEEETARVPVFEMRPSNESQTTKLWRDTFEDLVAAPVTDTDAGLFSSNPARFLDQNDDNIVRYRLIVRSIEVLSKEIAAVTAHHVARAMGIENSTETYGLMQTPALFGLFSSEEGLSFTEDELSDLQLLAKPMLLPGKSGVLRMKPFQMNPGQPSILTALAGISNQEFEFYPTGGRPDRTPEDMRYQVYYNSSAPLGVTWPNNAATGLMRASPPTFYLGTWYADAVYFRVVATDSVDGRSTAWTHRLNVLIDVSQLTGAQRDAAMDINEQIVSNPAR